MPKPEATVINQEQSAEFGYSSGYRGEKIVPLSDVMFPPQVAEGGGKAEMELEYIYIHTHTYITGPGIGEDRSIIQLQSVEKGDFSSPWSSASLLSVSLPLFFRLRLVPRRLSELKISQ